MAVKVVARLLKSDGKIIFDQGNFSLLCWPCWLMASVCLSSASETTTISQCEHDHSHHRRPSCMTTTSKQHTYMSLLMRLPLSWAIVAFSLQSISGSSGWIRQWESLSCACRAVGRSSITVSTSRVFAGPRKVRTSQAHNQAKHRGRDDTSAPDPACVGDWAKESIPPIISVVAQMETTTPAIYQSMYPQEHGPCPVTS